MSLLRQLARLCIAPLMLATTASCRGAVGPDETNLLLTVDQPRYEASAVGSAQTPQREFRLVARFENHSGETVYLANCAPGAPPAFGVAMAEGAAAGGESSAYNRVYACVGHSEPIPVRPGAIRADTFALRGPTIWTSSAGGQRVGEGRLTGGMQLQYAVRRCRDEAACPVVVRPRSTAFEVVAP